MFVVETSVLCDRLFVILWMSTSLFIMLRLMVAVTLRVTLMVRHRSLSDRVHVVPYCMTLLLCTVHRSLTHRCPVRPHASPHGLKSTLVPYHF